MPSKRAALALFPPVLFKARMMFLMSVAESFSGMDFKDPWNMTYLEYVDAIIECLKERLGNTHPLFLKKIFVSAVSNEPEAALIEIDTGKDMKYAVIYYQGNRAQQEKGQKAEPEVVYMRNEHDVQDMIDKHHREWLMNMPKNGCGYV